MLGTWGAARVRPSSVENPVEKKRLDEQDHTSCHRRRGGRTGVAHVLAQDPVHRHAAVSQSYAYGPGDYGYRDCGFWNADVAAGIVGTAGAIAAAAFQEFP